MPFCHKFTAILLLMGLSILHIIEAALLTGNALAILNEKRFLRKCIINILLYIFSRVVGLDKPTFEPGPRNQLSTFIFAVRTYMQSMTILSSTRIPVVPLIIANLIVVFLEIIIG